MSFVGENKYETERNDLRQIVANVSAVNPFIQNEYGDVDCCFFCGVRPYDTETHADRGCVWQAARDAVDKWGASNA